MAQQTPEPRKRNLLEQPREHKTGAPLSEPCRHVLEKVVTAVFFCSGMIQTAMNAESDFLSSGERAKMEAQRQAYGQFLSVIIYSATPYCLWSKEGCGGGGVGRLENVSGPTVRYSVS